MLSMRRKLLISFLTLGIGGGPTGSAAATLFKGVEVAPEARRYVVVQDLDARDKPDSQAKIARALEKGAQVEAVGTVKGDWVAIRQDNQDVGFVPGAALVPLIDGTLNTEIHGTALGEGGQSCQFAVAFQGKSPVDGEVFETSDYELRLDCKSGASLLRFDAFMFITEAPYDLTREAPHQISVDVTDVGGEYEEVLSTISTYRPETRKVAFDSVTLEGFGRQPTPAELAAESVPEALAGAVHLAVASWNDKAWKRISEIARP